MYIFCRFCPKFVLNSTDMYTAEEVARAKELILERMVAGKSLEAILREDMGLELPSRFVVYGWLFESNKNYDAVFYADYAHAYEIRAAGIFEETIEIADDGQNDTYIDPETGKTYTAYDVVQRSKLRIEARQWALARMNSKRFGTKVETTLQGGDRPIETVDYSKLSAATLEEIAKQANAGKSRS